MTPETGSAAAVRRSLRAVAARETRLFAMPRGRRELVPIAGLSSYTVAMAVDALVYVAACPFFLGVLAILLRGFWPVAAVAVAFAYLATAWATGSSPGMRLAGVRLVAERTGREPGAGRAALRAALHIPVAAAALLIVDAQLPSPQGSFSSDPLAFRGAMAVLVAGIASHLWALRDGRGRTLHDRLCGLVMIEVPARDGR